MCSARTPLLGRYQGDNAALAINNHNTIVANFEDTKKAKKERAWIRFE